MKCSVCETEIPQERLEALPDTIYCIECAKRHVVPVKGVMTYDHKTAPTLCIMDGRYFDEDWKRHNPSYGRGSGVHAMMPRPAGTK
jgi:hypothetical protein